MSSKRGKQYSENNRVQDIAPRFKRQKSFNSSKHSVMDSVNQTTSTCPRFKKSLGESQPTNLVNHQKGPAYPREGRKIVKKLSVQKAQNCAEKSGFKSSFVLSPMENKLFNLVRNDEFEKQDCSGFDLSYSNQDATMPNGHHFDHSSQPNPWAQTTEQNTASGQRTESPPASNYDPDTRTIEMLRELERVADQTDFGSEENNNDKNSLVSHHLRMLMCAVDRYTQGVDDDINDSCEEESLPSEEPQRIPSPIVTNPVQQGFYNNEHQQPSAYAFAKTRGPVPMLPAAYLPTKKPHMLTTWDLWSSPGFNGLDVYGFHEVPTSPNVNYHFVDPSNSFYLPNNGDYHMRPFPFNQ